MHTVSLQQEPLNKLGVESSEIIPQAKLAVPGVTAAHEHPLPAADPSDMQGLAGPTEAVEQLQSTSELAVDTALPASQPQHAAPVTNVPAVDQMPSTSAPDSLEEGQVSDFQPVAEAEHLLMSDHSDEEGQCSPHQQDTAAAYGHALHRSTSQIPNMHSRAAGGAGQHCQPSLHNINTCSRLGSANTASTEWLSQQLNPNNEAYNPAFAELHRAKRMRTDAGYVHRVARKEKSKLLKRIYWSQKSTLTPEEHCYLLDLQGESSASQITPCVRFQSDT